ncbi:MAG TPA: DNA polymerase III subunit beta [Saprospiraceae bacterium]|nr:DNA polymerase III subunit beta [Saprospiraceae bacterium]HPN67887.1 DNA polymerase III subunit beta [Saprospiraceae bacterium]
MKFEVSSQELVKKLQVAGSVIVANPVLPVTEDFLFNLDKSGKLTITATNVDTTIITSIMVTVIEAGSIAIPSKILLETLKALPEQPITISVGDNNGIDIQSSYGKYHLSGDGIEDFPAAPLEENVEALTFDCKKLASAISRTMFATSSDELRLAMTGVLMQIDFNKLIFVATDAHKLVKYSFFGISSEITESIILPKKVLSLLKIALPEDGSLSISFNRKNAFFKFGETSIITRLIDAKYPDYNAVIPVDNPNELIIDKKDFQNSLRRISIYASKSTNQIILNMGENSLTLSAQDLDFSNEATEQLPCRYNGELMSMGFNSKIFIEMLGNIDTEEAILNTSIPSRAGILVPAEQEKNEHLMMLVMPVLSTY